MRQQRDDCPGLHAETPPPERQRRVDSAKLVLPGQGHAQRSPQHGVRGAVSQSQRQESVWALCPAAGAEEIQGPDGRLRGRDVSTLLSSAGGPQAPHAGRAAIQERLASTGPSSRLRGWHGQLLTGGPRRGPPGGFPRAPPPLPPPPRDLGDEGDGVIEKLLFRVKIL